MDSNGVEGSENSSFCQDGYYYSNQDAMYFILYTTAAALFTTWSCIIRTTATAG